jgi:hypothetical protein
MSDLETRLKKALAPQKRRVKIDGACWDCLKELSPGKSRCVVCLEKAKTRARKYYTVQNKRKCTKCRCLGHNSQTCTAVIAVEEPSAT